MTKFHAECTNFMQNLLIYCQLRGRGPKTGGAVGVIAACMICCRCRSKRRCTLCQTERWRRQNRARTRTFRATNTSCRYHDRTAVTRPSNRQRPVPTCAIFASQSWNRSKSSSEHRRLFCCAGKVLTKTGHWLPLCKYTGLYSSNFNGGEEGGKQAGVRDLGLSIENLTMTQCWLMGINQYPISYKSWQGVKNWAQYCFYTEVG